MGHHETEDELQYRAFNDLKIFHKHTKWLIWATGVEWLLTGSILICWPVVAVTIFGLLPAHEMLTFILFFQLILVVFPVILIAVDLFHAFFISYKTDEAYRSVLKSFKALETLGKQASGRRRSMGSFLQKMAKSIIHGMQVFRAFDKPYGWCGDLVTGFSVHNGYIIFVVTSFLFGVLAPIIMKYVA